MADDFERLIECMAHLRDVASDLGVEVVDVRVRKGRDVLGRDAPHRMMTRVQASKSFGSRQNGMVMDRKPQPPGMICEVGGVKWMIET